MHALGTASRHRDATARAAPDRIDWLIAVLLTAGFQTQLALGDYEGSMALNVASGLLLTVPLLWRRRAPLAVLAIFGVTAVLNEALGGALFTFPDADAADAKPPLFASLAAGMVTFYSVGAHARERDAVLALALGIGALWITVFTSGQVEGASFVWSGGLIGATPWFAGRVARSRAQQMTALVREQDQRTRIALGEERSRIARELHDVVAHSVGVIAVQAQGARRVFDQDPERAREALESIDETARTALVEMRRSLGVLRREGEDAAREPQPGLADLEGLLERARAGGLEVELAVEGTPSELPQGVDLSAYRIIQEALTNTIKHAGGARSQVTLRYGERELAIDVTDDGRGPPEGGAETAQGHGLLGMRERVAAHAGRLRTGRGADGGFVVEATLPLSA